MPDMERNRDDYHRRSLFLEDDEETASMDDEIEKENEQRRKSQTTRRRRRGSFMIDENEETTSADEDDDNVNTTRRTLRRSRSAIELELGMMRQSNLCKEEEEGQAQALQRTQTDQTSCRRMRMLASSQMKRQESMRFRRRPSLEKEEGTAPRRRSVGDDGIELNRSNQLGSRVPESLKNGQDSAEDYDAALPGMAPRRSRRRPSRRPVEDDEEFTKPRRSCPAALGKEEAPEADDSTESEDYSTSNTAE